MPSNRLAVAEAEETNAVLADAAIEGPGGPPDNHFEIAGDDSADF